MSARVDSVSERGDGVRERVDGVSVALERRAVYLAYGYGVLVALAVGHFLLGLPIQLSDSFGNMVKLSTPWPQLMAGEFTQHSYLRPFLWAELKLVYDLSGGNYFAWFRGVHVLQIVLLTLLYLALVRPRTMRDAAILPLGLAVLIGLHTFAGTLREAFPINTFMTVLILCFATAVLSFASYRWWNDLLAVLLFVTAALTVESGLLVAVIVVGAALTGCRGISRAGVAAILVLLAGYFVLRFGVLDVGSPGLVERSAGFGTRVLDPQELVERFGSNPFGFYLYNVVTAMLSVLFSEPNGGVFRMIPAIARLDIEPSMIVNLVASLGATAIVATFAWRRRHDWLSRRFERDDRLVLLFLMVLGANAVFCYGYQKDYIMSPAGAFLAVAVFVAARGILASMPHALSRRTAVLAIGCCAIVATTWAARVAGTFVGLRNVAYVDRTEWAYAERSLEQQQVSLDRDATLLFNHLRDDALLVHPAPPALRVPLADVLGLE
jgi:hypothetical protein